MPTSALDVQVLFVCTGNICRSPMAEQIFRELSAKAKLPIKVTSAGVMAMTGDPMTPESAQAMKDRSYSPVSHIAKDVTTELLAEAELIICMTLEHRSEIARVLPRASKYSFTFDELARLVSYLSHDPEYSGEFQKKQGETRAKFIRRALASAALLRGMVPTGEDPRDIVDPYGESLEIYAQVAENIDVMSQVVIDWMAS